MRGSVRVVAIDSEETAKALISTVGADPAGIKIMAPKAVFRAVHVQGIGCPAALILKQEMLARGGEAAIDRGAITGRAGSGEVLLLGTLAQYRRLIEKLHKQPFGLRTVAEELQRVLAAGSELPPAAWSWRGRTGIMGILNVTPDSFSDGGKYLDPERALIRAREMMAAGADILDLGGESTRPGSIPVSGEEELQRILPVIGNLRAEIDLPISIDTYKAEVAAAALKAGAAIVNDVSGLKADPEMAAVVADHDALVVIMHNRKQAVYRDLMAEISRDLGESLGIALRAGIPENRILIDPGIGFGKTAQHNLEVLRRLRELQSLGRPILVGTSRKSFIGRILDQPPEQRELGTAATVALAIAGGAEVVRVHDVEAMRQVARMADAIVRGWQG